MGLPFTFHYMHLTKFIMIQQQNKLVRPGTLVISNLSGPQIRVLKEKLERAFRKSPSIQLLEIKDNETVEDRKTRSSQCAQLLRHFKLGHSVSAITAMRMFGITSLHRRLADLKDEGYTIKDEWVRHNKKKYKRYWMERVQIIESI